jgi:hypothetical protein
MRVHIFTLTAVCAIVTLSAAPGAAQGRSAAPKGQEIAAQAKAAKLDRANVGLGTFQGQRMALTPADLSHLKSVDDLKAGQVVGLLENGAAGDETGLPPGKYDLYLAEVGGQWHAYAEAGGQIVKEAVRADVLQGGGSQAGLKPQFREKGWCFDVNIFFGVWRYTICF